MKLCELLVHASMDTKFRYWQKSRIKFWKKIDKLIVLTSSNIRGHRYECQKMHYLSRQSYLCWNSHKFNTWTPGYCSKVYDSEAIWISLLRSINLKWELFQTILKPFRPDSCANKEDCSVTCKRRSSEDGGKSCCKSLQRGSTAVNFRTQN